jgi:transposase
VRLMPPAYVKPYVKRQKNDAADAEAICEALTRANMGFVETKTPEQQSCLMLHRFCDSRTDVGLWVQAISLASDFLSVPPSRLANP